VEFGGTSRKPASALKFPNVDGILKLPLEREDSTPPPGTTFNYNTLNKLHKISQASPIREARGLLAPERGETLAQVITLP
jgi:hypothetical protein